MSIAVRLVLLAILVTFGRFQDAWGQIDPYNFQGSIGVATALNQVSDSITNLQVVKRDVVSMIRSGEVDGKKRNQAENLESKADLTISELKKSRRKLSKFLNKVAKLELSGEPITPKLVIQFQKLATPASKLIGNASQTAGRLQAFVVQNKVEPADFRGAWNSNFGRVVFAQFDDLVVSGTYYYNGGGIIKGKVKGRILKGSYKGNDGQTGRFTIKMSDDGLVWGGSYSSSDGSAGGRWSGTKA